MKPVKLSDLVVTEQVAAKNTKTREEKRNGGRIENWALCDYYNDKTTFVVYGDIYGDDKWSSSADLRTSCIVKLDIEKSEVETLNTIYKLGRASNWAYQEEEAIE